MHKSWSHQYFPKCVGCGKLRCGWVDIIKVQAGRSSLLIWWPGRGAGICWRWEQRSCAACWQQQGRKYLSNEWCPLSGLIMPLCERSNPGTSCSQDPAAKLSVWAEDSERWHSGTFSLPSLHFPSHRGKTLGFKVCSCLITSLNYQLNNTWTLSLRADWWLPLLTLFYFYCLARASSFKSWIIRTETLRYSRQINPWPIDILL